jgi:5-(carboxyamino)imidazole ribonucleotide mutase
MARVDVAVFMGSSSDWSHLRQAVELLARLGAEVRVHVSSAHRTPERTVELVRAAEEDGCRLFICAAGMAAHLAGAVAAQTVKPVLGVPLPGGILDGVDALLSTVQMPGGVPVATFGVGAAGARNAAVFAAQVLGLGDPPVAEAVRRLRGEGVAKVEAGEREVRASLDG